jgi:hypothetical protein
MNVKRIALATIPALLVAGIVTVATVGSSGPATADDGGVTLEQRVVNGLLTQAEPEGTDEAPIERGIEHRDGKRGHGRIALETVAETLGMTTAELDTELQQGKTIAEIAVEQGSSAQAVIDALVAEVSSALDAAVANGRLTEEEAAEKLAEATERITTMVNEKTFVRPPNPIDTVADMLGMAREDVTSALRDGSTIADLASEQGVDLDSIVDTLTAEARAQIEAWVNGEEGSGFFGRGPGQRGHRGGPGGGPDNAAGGASDAAATLFDA